jgi:hypothetical protein
LKSALSIEKPEQTPGQGILLVNPNGVNSNYGVAKITARVFESGVVHTIRCWTEEASCSLKQTFKLGFEGKPLGTLVR